jgi:betaine-homocysteine S-methyltransferase
MLPILRAMRSAVGAEVGIAAQPAAFRTTDQAPCFTKLSEFPDDLETIQVSRREFREFGRQARREGIGYVGGCCGCTAAYLRALARGLADSQRSEVRDQRSDVGGQQAGSLSDF